MRRALALALAVGATGCPRRDDATAKPEAAASGSAPVAAVSASASVAVAITSAAPPGPPAPRDLEVGPVPAGLETAWRVTRIEGALVIASTKGVARLTGGPDAPKLEWAEGKVPDQPMYGGRSINAVYGRWPDAIDVEVSNNFGRVPEPTMLAFTGKGTRVTAAPGGGLGWILGSARVGASTLTGTFVPYQGAVYESFRGPPVARAPARFEDHCKPESSPMPVPTALFAEALAATEAGTMIAVGRLCKADGKPGAEVWDAKGASRVVELSKWTTGAGWARLLPGRGDELHALVGGVLLRYRGGAFDVVPGPGKPIQNLFASKDGVLHVNAGGAIHRREGEGWARVATLPFTVRFGAIELDDEGGIWVGNDGVRPLRPGGISFRPGCATPLVHLSDVSDRAPPRFGFPASRKVLDGFEDGSLTLLEFTELGQRRLGVAVKDEAEGRKLVDHWREKVKEDEPRLVCFKPSSAREIKGSAPARIQGTPKGGPEK